MTTLVIDCVLIKLVLCFLMILDYASSQQVDLFLPLSSAPGTLIGDLDTLSHPDLVPQSRAPYSIQPTADRDKVSLNRNTLTLAVQPLSETTYAISIIHSTGVLSLSLHFKSNGDNYRPFISPDILKQSVVESTPTRTILQNFTCKDYQTNKALSRFLSLEHYLPQMEELFTLAANGTLQVNSVLTALNTPFVPLLVTCQDPRAPYYPSHAAVVLNVTQTDPAALTCTSPLLFQLCEDTPLGIISDIRCYHPSYNFSSSLAYTVSNSKFNEENGHLTLVSSLNYEDATSLTFTVTVTDRLSSALTEDITVLVTVLPVNEFTPSLDRTEYHVGEDVLTPFSFQLEASDMDSGSHGEIEYRLVNPQNDIPFSLDAGGLLRIFSRLDYESISDYSVNVEVTDKLDPSGTDCDVGNKTSLRQVEIVIDDVNEHPSFVDQIYNINVLETAALNSEVGNVVCIDPDNSNVANGIISYSLEVSSTLFSVDSSGRLTSGTLLDFTQIPRYSFTVICTDQGPSPLQDTVRVNLRIIPFIEFDTSSYTAQIAENAGVGTLIIEVMLSLASITPHNFVTQSFSIISDTSNGAIVIDARSGEVKLGMLLPPGLASSQYQLGFQVTAELLSIDGSTQIVSATTTLTVSILNATGLLFSDVYSVNVSENVRGVELVTIMAFNSQTGSSSETIYSLLQPSTVYSLDNITGVLELSSSLDRELERVHHIAVTAHDMFNANIQASTIITLTVLDINDVTPQCVSFTQRHITGHFFATSTPLTPPLNCIDTDAEPPNNLLTYSLLGGSTDPNITVDPTTGEILGLGTLDVGLYNYTVVVSDQGINPAPLNTTEIVSIHVTENIFHPQFVNTPASIELLENHTLSTLLRIQVSDSDTGPPGDITLNYEVVSPSEDIFSLDSNTGAFSLLQSLDFERVKEYVVMFNATDNGRPQKYNSTVLTIVVLNLNDEGPKCEPLPTLRLDFDNHFPDFLLQIFCSDPDNLTDLLFYSISVSSNASSYFDVSDEGVFSTISSFQALSTPSFPVNLPIPITIGENDSSLVTEHVVNVLIGESGFAFEFTPISSPSIPEDASPGTLVAVFSAVHTPNQSSLLISYSIHSINPYEEFSINNDTGELRVIGKLDFEGVKKYNISIRAVDNALYYNLRLYETTILVSDVCDNPPIINHSQSSTQINQSAFSSQNKVIQSFPCSDLDSGANGLITCDIVGISPDLGVPFFSMSGCDLLLDMDLNGTCVPKFDLVINCTDLCDVISLRTVRSFPFSVSVKFENLNTPISIGGYYPRFINISENQLIPKLISTSSLHFTDLDCDPFNQTYFSITNSIPGYLISNNGDIYLNNSIDFDEDLLLIGQSHRVTSTVKVFDCPELLPSCQGTGPPNTVTVQFVDENDNRPVCQKYSDSIIIPETSPIGSVFPTSIICDDLDLSRVALGDVSIFSLVHFEINNTDLRIHERFQVLNITADFDKNSAELNVRLLQLLDHENSSRYVLHIRVFDGGSPPLYSMDIISLTILVRNINEHGPFYSPISLILPIREDFDIFTAVFNATAMDLDNPPLATSLYSLSVIPDEKFRIDNTTALISLASSLDRESVSSYEIQVSAIEVAPPSNRTATLNISVVVTDFNDNPPVLTVPPTPIEIRQSIPLGIVGTFSCIDRDEGISGMFDCDIMSPVFGGIELFSFNVGVSQSCTLSIESNPVPNCSVPLNHDLTINCTDKGIPSISSSFLASVRVMLENLQTPVIQNASVSFTLSESTPLGHVIGDLSSYVSDGDCGNFGVLQYSLDNQIPNSPNYVTVTDDGILRLINKLDFDDPIFGDPPTLTLEIIVQDNLGSGSFREARLNVTISITDSNDNPPTCTARSIDISIAEESLASQIISTMCYDLDSGLNGELSTTYSSNRSDLFRFEKSVFNSSHSQVSITPLQTLDFEAIEFYTVRVSVTDLGVPQLTANLTVNIYIENINDNTPFFLNPPAALSITENASPALVATITARDLDKDRFGAVSYTLITASYDSAAGFVDISQGNTSQFELDSHTGELNQIAIIDYESNVVFHFGVLASDGGVPPNTNKTYFNITIENVNEFNPQFESPISATLLQGAVNGTTVAFINVSDADRGDGFSCRIYTDSIPFNIVSSIFELNHTETGFAITLQRPVVCNDALLYQFNIVCNDTGIPSRQSSTTYNVSITPQNLNVPVASSSHVSLTVNENEPLGRVIFDVSSLLVDPDCAMQGSYRYSISSQLPLGQYFEIDRDKGEVLVNASIDFELVSTVTIGIRVQDDLLTGLTAINSVIQLTVAISDLNDNPPECLYTSDTLLLPEAMSPFSFTTRIMCSDSDTFTNMTAQILNTDTTSIFSVEMVPVLGTTNALVLHVLTDLDFESVTNYALQVLIQDPTNPSLNLSVSLLIEVYAVNEFAPIIDPPSLVYVPENNLVGLVIVNITVQHSDLNESLIFSITQDYPYVTSIDSLTGAISLNTSLDRENPEHAILHIITVYVEDTGVPPKRSMSVPFYFRVADLNDNRIDISFIGNDNHFQIMQSQSSGVVANLSCTDADIFIAAQFTCSIVASTNPLNSNNGQPVFAVSHGAEGPVCQIVATETPPCVQELRYELTLICNNSLSSSDTTSFDFVVHLVPENLNDPIVMGVFPLVVEINETSTKDFPIVVQRSLDIADRVSDADCGVFGEILYVIDVAGSNNIEYIALDNKTGVVTIIAEVDEEVLKVQTGSQRINIDLLILDNNGMPGFRSSMGINQFSIDILDEDDEPPECTPKNLSLTFIDNNALPLINIPAAEFQCTDPDKCSFTNLQAISSDFLFLTASNIKVCNSTVRTGSFEILFTRQADLEMLQQKEWDIVITVTDGKTGPMHSTFVYAHIELIDVNEFPIIFSQPSYELVVNATSLVGELNLAIMATDGDFTSEIRYSSSDLIFAIDPISGRVILTQPLNSTNQTIFQVSIVAEDLASSATNSVTLTVNVNHPPAFIKPMRNQFCTNSTDPFLTLPYFDNNLSEMLQFFFSPHSNPTLNISNSTSQVMVFASDPDLLDQTVPSQYTVIVRDSTGLTDAFTFNLTKCSSMTRREVSSSRTKRAVIKTVHFSQLVVEVYLPLIFPSGSSLTPQFCIPDGPRPIHYALLTANHSDWPFTIDSTSGEVIVTEVLGRLIYHVVLRCNNSLHDDIASYIAIVLDRDQYTPNFLEASYTFLIPENAPLTTILGSVTARTERMQQISYSLTDVNFGISPTNGSISLGSSLDFETFPSHTFSVTATNEDIISIRPSSTVSVTISVTDVNDNPPEFERDDYSAKIFLPRTSPLPVGVVIAQVKCVDADLDATNHIVYSLQPPHAIFGIQPSNGYIYIASNSIQLNRAYLDKFDVRCTDQTHIPFPAFDLASVFASTSPQLPPTCPGVFQFGLNWPETAFNFTSTVICPETPEVAFRFCSLRGTWEFPDMSNCRSFPFIPNLPPISFTLSNCYAFFTEYMSNLVSINSNIGDLSVDKLHLAGDIKLAMEYYIAAGELITCPSISNAEFDSLARILLDSIDELTKSHFSDAWLALTQQLQRNLSMQLLYIINNLSHRLLSPNANDLNSVATVSYAHISTELHPDPATTVSNPYKLQSVPTRVISFTPCYLQTASEELGYSYLNDSARVSGYLPSSESEGAVRDSVSTSLVGVYAINYTTSIQDCRIVINFFAREGSEMHACAIWEFSGGYMGSWNIEACRIESRIGNSINCSCEGQGIITVIGTTPLPVYPDCFPLPDLVAFIMFILSSFIIIISVLTSIVGNVTTYRKDYKNPSFYFKLHMLVFLCLAEMANVVGIIVIPYDDVCRIIAVGTHILFVFVFCWILMFSSFHLTRFLFPKKKKTINQVSILLFFAGYAFPSTLLAVSLIDLDIYGVIAPPETSKCHFLYCWISSLSNTFPTVPFICSALPLMLTQIVMSTPLFLHFFIPESTLDLNKPKRPRFNTKLAPSYLYSETIPGFIMVYFIGLRYAFLSTAYDGVIFATFSLLFSLLTSSLLISYHTGIISSFTQKSTQPYVMNPKRKQTEFVNAEDYETRLVARQHERVNWAFLNVQEERFYEEGRQLGAHFNIAKPSPTESVASLNIDF